MEAKLRRLALIHAHADDVRGQQITGELHALEIQPERGRQRMRKRGLAHARYVFQQQMSAGDQTGKRALYLCRLAQQYLIDLGHRSAQSVLQNLVGLLGNGRHGFFR